MTGRVCPRHEQWCPDGVCPYCVPESETRILPFRFRSELLAVPSSRSAPEIVCPHFGLSYPSPAWFGPEQAPPRAPPASRLLPVRRPEDCPACSQERIKVLGDALYELTSHYLRFLLRAGSEASAIGALHNAQKVLIADMEKWRGPR